MTSLLRTNPKGTGLQYGETVNIKPIIENYKRKDGEISMRYNTDIELWQSSIVWHEVRKEDEEAFRGLANKAYAEMINFTKPSIDGYNKALSEGIELPSERAGLKKDFICCKKFNSTHVSLCGQCQYGSYSDFYPYIKPIKKEEETQEELWDEAYNIFKPDHIFHWAANLDKVKQKFKIVRI